MTQISQLPSPPLLEVSHVKKHYDGVRPALDDISFSIKKGEFVSVIGPSGAGKSTLLRCINRMIEVSKGEVRFEGIPVGELNRNDLKKLRSKIGMIFQHYNLVERLTVIENVLHGRLGSKSTLAGALGRYTREEKKQAMRPSERRTEAAGRHRPGAGPGPENDSLRRTDRLAGSERIENYHGAVEKVFKGDAHHSGCQPASGGCRPQIFGQDSGRE
jgi:ABC-type sugar transport system ATPase subunit